MTLTEAERSRLIRDRQKTSPFWSTVHALGSLKFAVLLLLLLATACATATFTEAKFNTKVAHHYIYGATWFLAWLVLLCVNLFAVTMTRWPWQKKHAGFIITHYGIITLLAGAMVGRLAGFEANVTLNSNGPAQNQLSSLSEMALILENPITGELFSTSFDGEIARPSEKKPRDFQLPGSPFLARIAGYSEQLIDKSYLLPNDASDSRNIPGVALKFTSTMVPMPLEPILIRGSEENPGKDEFDFFGRGALFLLDQLPPKGKPFEPEPMVVERQFIRADVPDKPLIMPHLPEPSGMSFKIVQKGSSWQLIALTNEGEKILSPALAFDGKKRVYPAGHFLVEQENAWRNLSVTDGVLSDQPGVAKKPAAQLAVKIVRPLPEKLPTLLLALTPDRKLAFRSMRGGTILNEGIVAKDGTFTTGWGDWTVLVQALEPKGQIVRALEESTVKPMDGAPNFTGIRVSLVDPSIGPGKAQWIPMGMIQTLTVGGKPARIGYLRQPIPLDFSVKLDRFDVPRDEGSDQPSNFISHVTFTGADSKTHSAEIQMNTPATFPPDLWRLFTGSNYKFSQAGWDPDIPGQSTLQVLYDPGWILKWIGALMISAGIFTMFYLRPSPRKEGQAIA